MMDPNQMPMQEQGGEIMDQLGMAVQELVQMIGPEQMMSILQEVAAEIQQGGQEQPPMPPQGGAPMPQQMQPGTMAPPQGSGRTVGKPRMM
jgi:hypothetical protein